MHDRLFVPDASVLLKWVLRSPDEADADRALALKSAWLGGACELAVPSLWIFEVGNVLGLKQPATAEALLQAMVDLGLREESPRDYLASILDLVRTFRVTFYDAAYHALAVSQDGTMVTADRAYVRKARGAGHVMLIDEWRE